VNREGRDPRPDDERRDDERPDERPDDERPDDEAERAKAKRRARVFGEVLPEGTTDDRDPEGAADDTDRERWLRGNVPPHHGD